MQSFDIFFFAGLNKLLNKQFSCLWFEMPWSSCDVVVIIFCFRLQAAAMAKFESIKEQTATGLQHAIDEHKYTDISVDLKPSYVIIPETGSYKEWVFAS